MTDDDKIEELLYPLKKETKKSMTTLKKEFNEILKYDPLVKKEKDKAIKLPLARSILRKQYKKEVVEKEPYVETEAKKETTDTTETIIKEDEKIKLLEFLKSADLMIKIGIELTTYHIGNDKEKLLLFVCCCSSRLKPSNRVSPAVKGDTAEGKTNMTKSVMINLPKKGKNKWFAFGTKFTEATLEDDVTEFDLLFVLEKPRDKNVEETLKAISEDGMKIWKKDVTQDNKILKTPIYVPRKAVVWTSVEEETQEELSNRHIVITITSDKERYNNVAKKIKKDAHNLNKLVKESISNILELETTLSKALTLLEPVDDIIIPFSDLIPTDFENAREQRDFKRFLSILKTITWLNQFNRQKIKYENKIFLIATPEDFWWSAFLSSEILSENISGLDARSKQTLETIRKLSADPLYSQTISTDKDKISEDNWVDRKDLQTALKIKSVDTIKPRIKKLKHLNFIDIYQKQKYAPVYIKPTNQATNRLLFGYEYSRLYDFFKSFEEEIVSSYLVSYSYPISSAISSLTITKIFHIYNKEINKATKESVELPSKPYDSASFSNIVGALSTKLVAEISSLKQQQEERGFSKQLVLPTKELLWSIKQNCNHDEMNLPLLKEMYGKELIDDLINKNILIVQQEGNYRFTDDDCLAEKYIEKKIEEVEEEDEFGKI